MTLGQLASATSIPKVWSAVFALTAALAAFAVGGYHFGHGQGAVSVQKDLATSQAEKATLQAEKGVVQAEAVALRAQVEQLKTDLSREKEGRSKAEDQILDLTRQLAMLGKSQDHVKTCTYLQRQIEKLEQQITDVRNGKRGRLTVDRIPFLTTPEQLQGMHEQQQRTENAEVDELRQRAIAYTQQLVGCFK